METTSSTSDSDLEWDEPMQSVQELVEKHGIHEVPNVYIRPFKDRPMSHLVSTHLGSKLNEEEEEPTILPDFASTPTHANKLMKDLTPPIIDFLGLGDIESLRKCHVTDEVAIACEEWGFFQLINHTLSPSLLARVRHVAAQFFDLPLVDKQMYANSPHALTGYGSRMGTSKHSILDWGDYFLHYVWPLEDRDMDEIWPEKPQSYRSVMDEYSREVHKLYRVLMSVLSINLGLEPSYLEKAFGKGASHVLRMNYYPPCPQPHLTLGLGSHSDAGGLTFLLQDEVLGLELKKGDNWVLVKSIPNALSVNIGDQLQIISNGKYKSVEHRAIVNKHEPRMTIAVFCNPADDTVISPAPALLDEHHPPLYRPMTFGEFLASFFKKGLDGKGYVESFKNSSS